MLNVQFQQQFAKHVMKFILHKQEVVNAFNGETIRETIESSSKTEKYSKNDVTSNK